MADVGALVGWKFRAALVLGHVTAVDGDMLSISPISKPASQVRRKREKVLTEREMDPADVEEAMHRHGHMPRTATKSRGAKAQAIGLGTPSQMIADEGKARAAKRKREAAYKKEARGGRNAAAKAASPEAAEDEGGPQPPTPTTKARRGRGAAAKPAPARRKKAAA